VSALLLDGTARAWHRRDVRALNVAAVLALGVLAGSCDDDSSASGARPKVVCCKLEEPSCNGPIAGTNPDGSCFRAPQDAAPVNWRIETDDNGCPRYVVGPQSCYPPRRPDAGSDTGSDSPVGTACSDDVECDLSGRADSLCATYLPSPACVEQNCDPTASGKVCDEGRGTCRSFGSATVCLPRCTFGDDGAAPIGCVGRNACRYEGTEPAFDAGLDGSSGNRGFGSCFGGCTSDADCVAPMKCQRDFGICLDTPIATTKALGDACVKADAFKACSCDYGESGAGYCTRACRVDTDETCPAGYACDAYLPPEFTKAPHDMAGGCKKICTTDTDCAGLSSRCIAAGGLSVKVCRPM